MEITIELATGIVIASLILLVGHWFPWPRRVSTLATYTYGMVAMNFGIGYWLSSQPFLFTLLIVNAVTWMATMALFAVLLKRVVLHNIMVYTIGMIVILGIDSLWLPQNISLGLWLMAVIAGGATCVAWLYDYAMNNSVRSRLDNLD